MYFTWTLLRCQFIVALIVWPQPCSPPDINHGNLRLLSKCYTCDNSMFVLFLRSYPISLYALCLPFKFLPLLGLHAISTSALPFCVVVWLPLSKLCLSNIKLGSRHSFQPSHVMSVFFLYHRNMLFTDSVQPVWNQGRWGEGGGVSADSAQ